MVQFASNLSRVLCKTRLIFSRINGPIDSFVISALQDAGGYAISRQNNLQLHLGCHTCWLSYFYIGMPVVRTDGLSGGWFLGWVDYFIFLPMLLHWRASRARAPLKY